MLLTSTIEPRLRLLTGFILWTISAVLTCALLLSLANGKVFQEIMLVILALTLEATKILSWRKKGKARVLAYALIALSAFASLGAALQTVEGAKASFLSASIAGIKESAAYSSLNLELKSIDTEIALDLDRLGKLPSDFTTAAKNLSASLQGLRDRRESISNSIRDLETETGNASLNSNMFLLLGKAIGVSPEYLLLILLLFLSTSIEAGALILCAPNKPIERLSEGQTGKLTPDSDGTACMPPMKPYISPDEFLATAKTASNDLPYLLGQNRVSKLLKISPSEGRRIVRQLQREGKVEVVGKRLRLSEWEEASTQSPVSILEPARVGGA